MTCNWCRREINPSTFNLSIKAHGTTLPENFRLTRLCLDCSDVLMKCAVSAKTLVEKTPKPEGGNP